MSETLDAIVVGLGAMGSAALAALAARGRRVIGLDRFTPPHAFGSSHGKSRIIREAYFEDPRYVPLVQRAYERWADLERESGQTLLLRTGGLMIGPPGGALVSGALRSAQVHALPHRCLSAAEARAAYPALRVPDDAVAVREPRAGVLFPEACITAQLERARRHGAVIRSDEPAIAWAAEGDGVEVRTERGSIRASHLVLCAGAWLARHVPELELPLAVTRQALFWFEPAAHAERFAPARFPIFIWEDEPGRFIYGFPDLGDGIKIARHQEGEATDADHVRREVGADEIATMRLALSRCIPDAAGPVRETAVCLYTNTPDQHFIVDVHPEHPQVVIASPCSGHGFKFASALGEVLADLAMGRAPEFDLGPFRLERLKAPR
jgi:sarcosine oxidase